jgi:hypothetical protein
MANTYQRNKQNFMYRNGCAKEISKKIKDRKNNKLTYNRNNGIEREARYYRHHREKKAPVVCPRQKNARGETTRIKYGVDTGGEKEKRMSKINVDGSSTSSHDNKTFRT